MVDLLKRKKTENAQTVSDENAAMLPDDKKSKSEIATKKTNLILFIIAIGMLFVFFIGFIISSDKEKSEMNIPENKGNQIDTLKTIEDIYQIPYIKVMPDSVKVENQAVDENLFLQLALSVTNNPIKITDISVSFDIENLSLDTNDCIMRNDIAANGSCMINLTWLPTKTENRSGFIVVKYNDMDGEKIKNEGKIIRIPLSLRSIVVKPVEEEKTFDFAAEFDEEDDSDVSEEEQPDENIKQSVEIKSSQKTIVPDNCKKYASKAYDFSGTFIGWVQGNQDVFSPNCSKIIGTQQDDGMILETGTGRVIGKGVVFDNKKSEEKRVELTVPLLEDIIQKTTGTEEPNYEAIRANRDKAKSPDNAPRKVIGNEDIYRLNDVLNIYKNEEKKMIPFSILDSSQVSSLPKDERYVLRQSKPIPAVLNRPIYMSSDTENNQDITATVERNVFGGSGRTVIIPAGSQLIGIAKYPGGVGIQAVQKINISWNRLIRPDGAEFDLGAVTNYSADAQGRAGVPGKNDTEYMQQLFIKPLLYSALPVAMEALFPSTSKLVTRVKRSDGTYQTIDAATANSDGDYGYSWNESTYDLDMSSKDKMKAEVQQNFKSVMQKLIEDSSKQKIPFTVPAGTRIQVFLNKDIMLRIDDNIDDLLAPSEDGSGANKYGLSESEDGIGEYNFSPDSTSGATSFSGSGYTTFSESAGGGE